jgi:hypothetical protein
MKIVIINWRTWNYSKMMDSTYYKRATTQTCLLANRVSLKSRRFIFGNKLFAAQFQTMYYHEFYLQKFPWCSFSGFGQCLNIQMKGDMSRPASSRISLLCRQYVMKFSRYLMFLNFRVFMPPKGSIIEVDTVFIKCVETEKAFIIHGKGTLRNTI